ncbi:MAG TPA: hypothetical protein VHO91_18985 [Rhodopila sp.]|nr:hypothetical protein [Rhodopila sp.]
MTVMTIAVRHDTVAAPGFRPRAVMVARRIGRVGKTATEKQREGEKLNRTNPVAGAR